ncbi:porin [Kaistia nematophila]|uniref:Porin n=1 Tax=Kaistia nematophila TaxID=2994654 RepID=A0A9X3EE50_9HYPH|nr:porin [Kaistia nematophila]MCX5571405.1 porin [Kaistia nematophila]
MNFKTLLLGSAAAMLMAGGAQAADLTVAEPVDYVKVCDAFGAGFFYSPGTDTCIKIGGYVKFGTAFGDSDFGYFNAGYDNSNWGNFYTEVSIQATASTVTEYGNLTGFIDMRAQTGNTFSGGQTFSDLVNSSTNSAYVDSAYLELGPLKAGRFTSLFDFGRGYNDTGMFGSDSTTDHIQLTYAVNGFGLAISVEDNRDRGALGYTDGILVDGSGDYFTGGNDNIPDIVGAVTYASGIFSAKVAAAYVNEAVSIGSGSGTLLDPYNLNNESGWAIGGGLEIALDSFSAGDRFFVSAAYGDNANSFTGITGGTSVAGTFNPFSADITYSVTPGTSWSALASYKHVWSPQLWSSLSGGYANFDGSDQSDGVNVDAWRVGFTTAYTPVKGLDLVGDVFYSNIKADDNGYDLNDDNGDSAWNFNLFLKRSW